MSSRIPRVSIGVPVYNARRFLRETLDSLLAQTFTDFELIICDNCSTDGTEEICREYAARDARVRFYRNDKNLGPSPNYNRCFELARGELFKWAAADDICAPNFLKKCVEKLDSDPSLVSVYTRTLLINDLGKPIHPYELDVELDYSLTPLRFALFVFANHRKHNAHELWGVSRMSMMRRTPPKGSFPSADRIVVAWWLLQGKMGRVEDYLFWNREHQQRSQLAIPNREFRPGSHISKFIGGGPSPPYEWWDASTKGKIVYPEWKWVWEYLRAVRETPMPRMRKIGCYAVMAGLYAKFLPRLARDLIIAAELKWHERFGRHGTRPTAKPKARTA